MLFRPAGCSPLVAVNSKDLYTYVWIRSRLSSAPIVRDLLGEPGGSTFYAEPTWDATTDTLVVDDADDRDGSQKTGALGLRLGAGCTFQVAWESDIGGGVDPQPLVAGRVVFVPAAASGSADAARGGSEATSARATARGSRPSSRRTRRGSAARGRGRRAA